jgi:D-alanyl-lipoteichoic acid acyltransferase DltB (MBOAT superfamily)
MILGGLWHGAAWRFIIWGALHGVWLAIHKGWIAVFGKPSGKPGFWGHFLRVFLTFNLVNFAWIFFRAADMQKANAVIARIGTIFNGEQLKQFPEILSAYGHIFALMLVAYIIHWLPKSFKTKYQNWFINMHWSLKVLIAVVIAFILYQAKSSDVQPFIYFQF